MKENTNDLRQSSIHNVVLNKIATQLKSFEYLIRDLKEKEQGEGDIRKP